MIKLSSEGQDSICQRSILSDERLIEFAERTAREITDKFGIPRDKIIWDTDPEED